MKSLNFLIGKGEVLTSPIDGNSGFFEDKDLETWDSTKERLSPMIDTVILHMKALTPDVCPGDRAVINLNMYPKKIAKSYFPTNFLREFSLESIGSRTVPAEIKNSKNESEPTTTTQYIIAGKRKDFETLSERISQLPEDSKIALDLRRIEKLESRNPEESIVTPERLDKVEYFEVVLHLLPSKTLLVKEKFRNYAETLSIEVFYDKGIEVGNLFFLPIKGKFADIKKLASYVFIRVIRNMPRLRTFPEPCILRQMKLSPFIPDVSPLNNSPGIRVGILDGGIPPEHPIRNLVHEYQEMDPEAADSAESIKHGLSTTSAYLFGSIANSQPVPRPYTHVDHIRIIDQDTIYYDNPLQLYDTLNKLHSFFMTAGPQYQFLNLSLGPDVPIQDTEVHSWTAVIDDFLKNGTIFMTIAAGNNGEKTIDSGNERRILVPSDAVNAVTVGAVNKQSDDWKRASYSAVGPGRLSGVVKPDLVCFGGSMEEPFYTLSCDDSFISIPNQGTSYAAPALLRTAAGIKTILGPDITPLAIKALLVHTAEQNEYDKEEVGWGKIQDDMTKIIACNDTQARILYQGKLRPGKYLEAKIPVPSLQLQGNVKLTATFCYACPVDPQDAAAYTQAALEIVFRPSIQKRESTSKRPKSSSFFKKAIYANEKDQREHDGKWETVLHAEKNMRGTSLVKPSFDIHYIAREKGGSASHAGEIPYALVITLEAPKQNNLYNEILQAYPNILIPFEPQIEIPLSI